MKKTLRLLLIGIFSLSSLAIFFTLFGSILGYLYFKSPTGLGYLRAKIQKLVLEKSGFTLNYEAVEFEPFSRIHIHNLNVKNTSQANLFEVNIEDLEMRYRISLWALLAQKEKLFEVTALTLEKPKIKGEFLAPAPSKSPSPEPALRLPALPLSLVMHQVKINHLFLNIDLKPKQPENTTWAQRHIELNDLNLHTQLDWNPLFLAVGKFETRIQSVKVAQVEHDLVQFELHNLLFDARSHLTDQRYFLAEAYLEAQFEKQWKISANTNTKWEKGANSQRIDTLTKLDIQSPFGNWTGSTESDLSILTQDRGNLRYESRGRTKIHQSQNYKDTSRKPLVLAGHQIQFKMPVQVKHNIKVTPEKTEVYLETQLSDFAVQDFPYLTQAAMTLKGHLFKSGAARIDQFLFSGDNPARHLKLSVVADGSGHLSRKNLQSEGVLNLTLDKPLEIMPGQTLQGSIEIPWTLAVNKGKRISLNGMLHLSNVNWTKSASSTAPHPMYFTHISGRLPISEDLVWDGKQIAFDHLIHQNPFERVDFDRFQPMIQESEQITIDKIHLNSHSYGPLQGFFSLRQNMLFAHKFTLELGRGTVCGEMALDTHPSSLGFGLLTRMTGIYLKDLLPPSKGRPPKNQKEDAEDKISGRTALVVNLKQRTIDGRIDLTEMGQKPLLRWINFVDPKLRTNK